MSKRYPGGLITKTPVTPTTSSAPGVWTLEQALQYIKAGTWPLYVLSDPYFNYVTMLLHGDGTNGAQNNTFLDSSTNNFTITRNGNTTQGTFSPYGSNWSNYFDGSSYEQLTDTTAIAFGSSDFTVEAFVFPTNVSGTQMIASKWSSASGPWQFFLSTNTANFSITTGSGQFDVQSAAGTIVANTWTHIAVVRQTTSLKIYINGTLSSTTSIGAVSVISRNDTVQIGARTFAGAPNFSGYISNLRTVTSAVYTSAFTPSTTPLTAISGTSLLTCQSNRFIDNSTNAFAITVNGTPSVQRFSPFSPTAAYSTSTIGGSYYSPGASGLTTTYSGSVGSTADFTVEGWFYLTANADNGNLAVCAAALGIIFTQSGQKLSSYFPSTGFIAWQSTALVKNTWHHIVVQRSSSTLSCYLNGTLLGTQASATGGWNWNDSGLYLLGQNAVREVGYASNVRISSIARYSGSTISVPTSPVTSDANTTFLLNFTNGGIFDNAMMNNLETVGNAQISTSVFKYGTGSMAFDGSGDCVSITGNPNLTFGTGDFTIEMWINSGANGTSTRTMGNGAGGSWSSGKWVIATSTPSNPNKFIFAFWNYNSGSGDALVSTVTANDNAWHHYAVTRSGSTLRLFIDGNLQQTITSSASIDNGTPAAITVGRSNFSADADWAGYIDDLRITKGYARYTANFTPPAAAFPNQ
jgi:hypothetical protein